MCSGMVFQSWQAECIRHLTRDGHRCVLLILDKREVRKPSFFRWIASYPWGKIVYNLCHRTIFRPPSKNPVDLSGELGKIPVVECFVEKQGYSEYFNPRDIETIKSYRPDFILRFGFNIIRGPVLEAARYGIWSFHHDDEMKYRGGPPAFWEIWRRDPVSAAILQRITEKLDSGIIVRKGYFRTIDHSYRANLEQLLEDSAGWPALVASLLAEGEEINTIPTVSQAKVLKVPGNLLMLFYLARLFINKIKFHSRELFCAEFWHSGIIRKPAADLVFSGAPIPEKDIAWLPSPGRSEYHADPSGFFDTGQLHLFFEDYDYKKMAAGISGYILDPSSGVFSEKKEILPGNPHLSYPFVFLNDNIVYCIPESSSENRIWLYRYDEAAGRMMKDHILLDGIDAVDPTLVSFENSWWLFFTLKSCSNTHLHIYYSPELRGPYLPHLQNPVKTDIRSARPAGRFFMHEGILYRPAQDCSRTYGNKVVINKVIRLSAKSYREEVAGVIGPLTFGRFTKGFHTFNAAGPFTLFDAKRYRFSRHHFLHQLRLKILGKHDQ